MSARYDRAEPAVAVLRELGAFQVWEASHAGALVEGWILRGRVLLLLRYPGGDGRNGWDLLAPIAEGNSVATTLDALRELERRYRGQS